MSLSKEILKSEPRFQRNTCANTGAGTWCLRLSRCSSESEVQVLVSILKETSPKENRMITLLLRGCSPAMSCFTISAKSQKPRTQIYTDLNQVLQSIVVWSRKRGDRSWAKNEGKKSPGPGWMAHTPQAGTSDSARPILPLLVFNSVQL